MSDDRLYEYRLVSGVVVREFDVRTGVGTCLVEGANGARWEVSAATASILRKLRETNSADALRAEVAMELGVSPDSEQFRAFLDSLVGQGILTCVDDRSDAETSATSAAAAAPRTRLASLAFRTTILSPRWAAACARPLQLLMTPSLFWAAFVATAIASFLIFHQSGASSALLPSRLFSVETILLVLFGGLAHELGHVAAARRFGAHHGRVGFGLYLVFPVFFVELDDVWKLSRVQRSIVDLAGLYAQLLVALLTLGVSRLFLHSAPSFTAVAGAAFAVSAANAVVNLNPVFRLDGYWLLSDALGIANLRERSAKLFRSLAEGNRIAVAAHKAHIDGVGPSILALLLIYSVASAVLLTWWLVRLLVALPSYIKREVIDAVHALATQAVAGHADGIAAWVAVGFRVAVAVVIVSSVGLLVVRAVRATIQKSA